MLNKTFLLLTENASFFTCIKIIIIHKWLSPPMKYLIQYYSRINRKKKLEHPVPRAFHYIDNFF
jgi:hypothetical protein